MTSHLLSSQLKPKHRESIFCCLMNWENINKCLIMSFRRLVSLQLWCILLSVYVQKLLDDFLFISYKIFAENVITTGDFRSALIISKYIHHLLFYLVLGKSNDSYPTQCSCINATFSMVNCALYTGRWISKAQSQIETPSKYTSKEIELEKNY